MGAWDATAFGNDEALDMVLDLLEHPHPGDVLSEILGYAKNTGYLNALEGSCMVAAAAVVAVAKGGTSIEVPPNIRSWIEQNESLLTPLSASALEAIARVRGEESELHELWQESDELSAWIADLDGIATALS